MIISVIDVAADGNCFYTCVARALAEDARAESEFGLNGDHDEDALHLRKWVAGMVLCDPEVRDRWVPEQLRLATETDGLLEEFECLQIGEEAPVAAAVARRMMLPSTWASQLEVEIMRRLLMRKLGVQLVVANVERPQRMAQYNLLLLCRDMHYQYCTFLDFALIGDDAARRVIKRVRKADFEKKLEAAFADMGIDGER